MIIQLESATAEDVQAARRDLETIARDWGHDVVEEPAEDTTARAADDHDKVIDPVSLATLVVSIPSAALAVSDLADRIRKRRRAKELIDQAQQMAGQKVNVCLVHESRTVEIRTLTPDQLLELVDSEEPAG